MKINDIFSKNIKKAVKNSENLPLSVQIVGLPFEDEKCLKVMKLIENNF